MSLNKREREGERHGEKGKNEIKRDVGHAIEHIKHVQQKNTNRNNVCPAKQNKQTIALRTLHTRRMKRNIACLVRQRTKERHEQVFFLQRATMDLVLRGQIAAKWQVGHDQSLAKSNYIKQMNESLFLLAMQTPNFCYSMMAQGTRHQYVSIGPFYASALNLY